MIERSLLFFVGRCAKFKLCARKKHLWVIEHLCLEIPQKKQRRLPFFVSGYYSFVKKDLK
jgi:hypothetical protein